LTTAQGAPTKNARAMKPGVGAGKDGGKKGGKVTSVPKKAPARKPAPKTNPGTNTPPKPGSKTQQPPPKPVVGAPKKKSKK
jgi:hypothetical protein